MILKYRYFAIYSSILSFTLFMSFIISIRLQKFCLIYTQYADVSKVLEFHLHS